MPIALPHVPSEVHRIARVTHNITHLVLLLRSARRFAPYIIFTVRKSLTLYRLLVAATTAGEYKDTKHELLTTGSPQRSVCTHHQKCVNAPCFSCVHHQKCTESRRYAYAYAYLEAFRPKRRRGVQPVALRCHENGQKIELQDDKKTRSSTPKKTKKHAAHYFCKQKKVDDETNNSAKISHSYKCKSCITNLFRIAVTSITSS